MCVWIDVIPQPLNTSHSSFTILIIFIVILTILWQIKSLRHFISLEHLRWS